jgi:hypothetical protein
MNLGNSIPSYSEEPGRFGIGYLDEELLDMKRLAKMAIGSSCISLSKILLLFRKVPEQTEYYG